MTNHEPTDRAAQAAKVGCAALVDAMGRLHGHRAHMLPFVSPDPTRPMFGRAVTMAFVPFRDDSPESGKGFADFFHQALAPEPEGRVLVMSSGGYPEISHAGGTKLYRGVSQQIAGVLCDGLLRDFDELRSYPFATWCRGEATRWGGDTVMPHAANVAVEVRGVTVYPGDYVYADSAGAVVIPAASIDRVLDEAAAVDAEDAHSIEQIKDERPEDFLHG